MAAKPKLGDLIDSIYAARERRIARQKEMEAEIEDLKADEKRLEDQIINTFSKNEINGARGEFAQASVSETTCAKLDDYMAVWKWAKKNDAHDLFYKRISSTAYAERVAAGDKIPGVSTYIDKKLSITKVKNGK